MYHIFIFIMCIYLYLILKLLNFPYRFLPTSQNPFDSTLLNRALIILKSNHILRVSIRSFSFTFLIRKCSVLSQRKLIPLENPVYSISLRSRYIVENANTKERKRLNWKISCKRIEAFSNQSAKRYYRRT